MAKNKGVDYALLAEGMDDLRNLVRVMVAGFVNEGFTEEQARVMVAGFFAAMVKASAEDES